jgi:hypothetical protein
MNNPESTLWLTEAYEGLTDRDIAVQLGSNNPSCGIMPRLV